MGKRRKGCGEEQERIVAMGPDEITMIIPKILMLTIRKGPLDQRYTVRSITYGVGDRLGEVTGDVLAQIGIQVDGERQKFSHVPDT